MNPYPTYKDSGIAWLGEIPSHWEVKRLKYIAGINPGRSASSLSGYLEQKAPFLPMESVFQNGNFEVSYKRVVSSVLSGFTFFEEGDVILAKITPCFENGKGALLENLGFPFGFGSTEFHVFRAKGDETDRHFLFYITRIEPFRQIGEAFMSGAAGQKRVSSFFLETFALGLPPLPEQRAIAAYLDQQTQALDTLIADKRRLITLYQEERAALINQAVTRGLDPNVPMQDSGIEWLGEIPAHWEVKRLKYVVKQVIGGGTPPTGNPMFWNGDIPWVSPKDMKFNRITGSQDYITEAAIQESAVKWVPVDAVLIVVRSGILKHSFPVAINNISITLNQDMKAFIPSIKLLSEYLWFLFKGLSSEILTFCSKIGATVDSIEMELLLNFSIALPSLEEQKVIIQELNAKTTQLNQQISDTEREIKLLQEYRTALISEVVTGKVQVPHHISAS